MQPQPLATIVTANGKTAGLKRAGDGIRTHDNNVGNVVLYQLSYARDFDLTTSTSLPVDIQSAVKTF